MLPISLHALQSTKSCSRYNISSFKIMIAIIAHTMDYNQTFNLQLLNKNRKKKLQHRTKRQILSTIEQVAEQPNGHEILRTRGLSPAFASIVTICMSAHQQFCRKQLVQNILAIASSARKDFSIREPISYNT